MLSDKMQDKKQKAKAAESDESFQGDLSYLSLSAQKYFVSPRFMLFQ